MIAVLIVSILALSIFCSFVLNKQYLAVFLVVLSSSQMPAKAENIVLVILFTAILHFLNAFFSTKRDKLFLLISLLPVIYILAIFAIQPYIKIWTYYYLGYLAALFIFAWIALIKWDIKEIVNFLTAYGLYLVLAGFIEKIVTDSLRIGKEVLTVATAYAVVLAVAWVIWAVNVFLNKIYSMKIILLGTFLVFLAILFSGTRMGLLGIFIGFGLCGLSSVFIKSKNMSIAKMAVYSLGCAVLLLFIGVLTWNLLPNDLFIKESFSKLSDKKLDDSSLGRIFMWAAAVDIFEHNKILGAGAGSFPDKFEMFLNSIGIHKTIEPNIHAHNIYLIMLSEHGIIGFLFLMAFAFFCMLRVLLHFIRNRESPVFYAFLSGFIVMAILGLIDAIPLYLPTAGFAAWFFGVCASFSREKNLFLS